MCDTVCMLLVWDPVCSWLKVQGANVMFTGQATELLLVRIFYLSQKAVFRCHDVRYLYALTLWNMMSMIKDRGPFECIDGHFCAFYNLRDSFTTEQSTGVLQDMVILVLYLSSIFAINE